MHRIRVRHTTGDATEYTGTYSIERNYVHIQNVATTDGSRGPKAEVIVPFDNLLRLTATKQPAQQPTEEQ